MNKSSNQIVPVILCGGSGARLWLLSRAGFPKQFLSLTGNESLFQQAAQRLAVLGADDIQLNPSSSPAKSIASLLPSSCAKPALNSRLARSVGGNTSPALTLAALEDIETSKTSLIWPIKWIFRSLAACRYEWATHYKSHGAIK